MFGKLFVSAAFVATALAQTFTVNTPPSLIQCQPASISWTGGSSPFTLSAIPEGQTSAPAIEFIATGLTASPYTWTVNLATGLAINIRLTDATGNSVYTSGLTIQSGPSNSCLNTSASTSGLSTTGVVSSTVSGASSSGAASSAASSSMAMSSTSRASSSAAASTSAAASSGNAASSVTSAAGSATSAAASSTSKAGAFATAVAGVPAIALAAIGGVAALL